MWTMASARAWPSRDEPNAAPPSLSPFVVVAPLVTSTNPKIVRPVLYGGLAKKSLKSRRVAVRSEMTTAKNETNPHGLGRVTAWMLTVTNVLVGTAMTEANATEHRAIVESAKLARPAPNRANRRAAAAETNAPAAMTNQSRNAPRSKQSKCRLGNMQSRCLFVVRPSRIEAVIVRPVVHAEMTVATAAVVAAAVARTRADSHLRPLD